MLSHRLKQLTKLPKYAKVERPPTRDLHIGTEKYNTNVIFR